MGFNEYSKKPKTLRKPTTSWDIVIRAVQLRKRYPSWSKYKIRVLLEREGIKTSASAMGRILKRRGLINMKTSQKRRKAAINPKARFPKGLRISEAGDMVQTDIKHIMLVGGKRFYQFTAIDVLTKRRILRVYPFKQLNYQPKMSSFYRPRGVSYLGVYHMYLNLDNIKK